MQTAFDVIKGTYDYETCKEIVNHGCQSGVCSQHIYYADTIEFFDNYEEEITDYIITSYGTEFLANIFTANDCNLDWYLNDVVWCYIECIAGQIVDEYESTTCEELSLSYAWFNYSHLCYYSDIHCIEEYYQSSLDSLSKYSGSGM